MVGVLFSALVIVAFLSGYGEVVMRIRLAKSAPNDKIAWWRLGGDEVAATYEELFPDSRLPLFRRFAFWLLVVFACLVLFFILWKSN
jgi:hypothetical protein